MENGSDAASSSFESSSSQEDAKQGTKSSSGVEGEKFEENPISQMMALKHPEQVKAIDDATIEDMAKSHNSSPNRSGVLM